MDGLLLVHGLDGSRLRCWGLCHGIEPGLLRPQEENIGSEKAEWCSKFGGGTEIVYNSVFDAVKSQSILTNESGSV